MQSQDFNETTVILASQPRPGVLLVEDDPATCELLSHFIRAEGFEVTDAATAEQALELVRKESIPIVITDLQLPGMDGLELCRELRSQQFDGYVYIIVLTGQPRRGGVVAALRAGADDYLQKDVSREELAARLQTAMRIVSLERQLRLALNQQRRLALTDALTAVPNQRAFSKHFNAEFKRAVRFGEDLAVLLLDVDHFKLVNDQHGHTIGDHVLKAVATRVAKSLPRSFDFFARLGGEEFAVILPQTDLDGAAALAERLRGVVADNPFQCGGQLISITVSIGVSAWSERRGIVASTPEDVLELADQRLYASKRSGRNRVTSTLPRDAQPRSLSDSEHEYT
jgi:two-component system cell cycle response regulator